MIIAIAKWERAMHSEDGKQITIDITKLREERRPLWMSPLGVDHYADMLGNGGDIWTDRLVPEWQRFSGEELAGSDLEEAKGHEGDYPEEMNFSSKSQTAATVEEAFHYVHPKEEEREAGAVDTRESSKKEDKKQKRSGGIGVGLGIDVDIS
jgi:hypothetical protein